MADPFDRSAYLARIGLTGSIAVSEDGLERLHRAQVYSIPFENFEIQLGRPLDLSPSGIFRKLVTNRRGGYCFELNGLFLQALHSFGFVARALLARVHMGGEPSGRTHQISLIRLNGREWIGDVGFGAGTLRRPIPFEVGRVDRQDDLLFRLVERGPYGFMLQTEKEEGWLDLYSFDLTHVCQADILTGNHYTETHPDSHFTRTRIAALATPTGRIALQNFTLRQVVNGQTTISQLIPGQPYLDGLAEHFGLYLNAPYGALRMVETVD